MLGCLTVEELDNITLMIDYEFAEIMFKFIALQLFGAYAEELVDVRGLVAIHLTFLHEREHYFMFLGILQECLRCEALHVRRWYFSFAMVVGWRGTVLERELRAWITDNLEAEIVVLSV